MMEVIKTVDKKEGNCLKMSDDILLRAGGVVFFFCIVPLGWMSNLLAADCSYAIRPFLSSLQYACDYDRLKRTWHIECLLFL